MQVRRAPGTRIAHGVAHPCHATAKSQLTKANQTKTKMENLARELQKVTASPYTHHVPVLTVPAG